VSSLARELRVEGRELRARGKGALGVVVFSVLTLCARGASAYDEIIAPIFEARCVACHGEEKRKGRLELHTWEAIEKGGGSGPLWVAGKPAESELVRRLQLPLDDEEHMPPSDEAQPAKEEIALVARWIEGGASRSATVAELKLSPDLAKAAQELKTRLPKSGGARGHREVVVELDPAAVKKLRAPQAKAVSVVQEKFPGALSYESRSSAQLHFTAAGLGGDFGDSELAALAPVAATLVSLDLSGTRVTDRSAALLARFTELRVLRLGFTRVSDEMVRALAALRNLEVIALANTAVTGNGLRELAKLPALRSVHLGSGNLSRSASEAGLPVVDPGFEALDVPEPTEKPTASAAKTEL
jgi:mono/diheme cytochrome c family protein